MCARASAASGHHLSWWNSPDGPLQQRSLCQAPQPTCWHCGISLLPSILYRLIRSKMFWSESYSFIRTKKVITTWNSNVDDVSFLNSHNRNGYNLFWTRCAFECAEQKSHLSSCGKLISCRHRHLKPSQRLSITRSQCDGFKAKNNFSFIILRRKNVKFIRLTELLDGVRHGFLWQQKGLRQVCASRRQSNGLPFLYCFPRKIFFFQFIADHDLWEPLWERHSATLPQPAYLYALAFCVGQHCEAEVGWVAWRLCQGGPVARELDLTASSYDPFRLACRLCKHWCTLTPPLFGFRQSCNSIEVQWMPQWGFHPIFWQSKSAGAAKVLKRRGWFFGSLNQKNVYVVFWTPTTTITRRITRNSLGDIFFQVFLLFLRSSHIIPGFGR